MVILHVLLGDFSTVHFAVEHSPGSVTSGAGYQTPGFTPDDRHRPLYRGALVKQSRSLQLAQRTNAVPQVFTTMGPANTTIATAAGHRVTPPKAQIPTPAAPSPASPLVRQLATVIGERWTHGADFMQIADAVLDAVAHHIRTASMTALHPAIADAIEDHMTVDPMEGDVDQASECSVEDIEAHYARQYARHSITVAQRNPQMFTTEESAALIGAMLKRPSETQRYQVLREGGHTPASAVAIILTERKHAAARKAHAESGGVR